MDYTTGDKIEMEFITKDKGIILGVMGSAEMIDGKLIPGEMLSYNEDYKALLEKHFDNKLMEKQYAVAFLREITPSIKNIVNEEDGISILIRPISDFK